MMSIKASHSLPSGNPTIALVILDANPTSSQQHLIPFTKRIAEACLLYTSLRLSEQCYRD